MVLVTSTKSLYNPPAILTNLKSCFIAVNIPSAKQCNSFLMYYLKVSPLCHYFLCISILLYPASDSAFAPPDINEWVSTLYIGIPFKYGYFNAVVSNFNAALLLWALRYLLFPSAQCADKYVFLFLTFFRIDTKRLPNALTGINFSSPLCYW